MIKSMEKYDPNLVVIACTSDAAFVKTGIKDDYFNIVRGSYADVRKTDSFSEITGSLLKITVYDPNKESETLKQYLAPYTDRAYIVSSEPAWLDVTDCDTHKGETVKKLQGMLGITKEETMSFGDGENDVELMNISKYSFAMRNASENTKEAANFITKSNEKNGALETIQKIMDLL